MSDHYRQAASILVLRSHGSSSTYELLLLHKPRKNDAWQLPQGGVEGNETTEQAAVRELQEEAGVTGCTVLGVSDSMYRYDFPPSYRRFRRDNVCGQEIHFVFALAPENATVTVDDKEVDNHVWITPEELPKYVKREAYQNLVHGLLAEANAALATRAR